MHSKINTSRLYGLLVCGPLAAASYSNAIAEGRTLTARDYAQAERYMVYKTRPLVDHAVGMVHWLDGTHFWYLDHDASGDHYMQMDAAGGSGSSLVDQAKLAAVLSKVSGKPVKADKLGIIDFRVAADGRDELEVVADGRDGTEARGKQYLCDLKGAGQCVDKSASVKTGTEPGVLSPDRKEEAFIRNWNLWLRDVATGEETQLTNDGVVNFGYATDNAGWKHTNNAILEWSPDSKQIATFQQDQRQDGDMYLVTTRVGHPELHSWKYPLPGDEHVTMIERVIIDVPGRKVVRLEMPADQHRSSLCDDVSCGENGGWDDVKWAPDGKTLAFVSTSRDHKHETFRIADANTGEVRTAFHEDVATYYESGNGAVNWRYLSDTHEVVWFSERNNWGNLYLYDAASGQLQHAITTGDGNVTKVLKVDPKTRTVWFRGVGRTPGVNPYYQQFWKVSLDGGQPELLSPEPADHTITMSQEGEYFVDSYSTTNRPPVTVLRDANDGHTVTTVAKADISRLLATGWQPPEQIVVKARDGKTDLYGLMFKPTHFDPDKKYPAIDYIYPGPQTGSVQTYGFTPSQADDQSLAELGFIVVAIDGMGTSWRSKAFHDAWFGNMGDNTLPDQVAAIKQLGRRYPWIDLDRVGIWGRSGGGNASADAMFRYPDLFKVGWSESGNHDNREYEDDWAEKWQGLLVTNENGTTNYDDQANQNLVKGLKGRLILVHGTIDDNVPPYNTLLVADALIKANKDFDLLLIPNQHHHYASATPYVTRRRWDYFVRYLGDDTPPKEYELEAWPWR